MIIRKPYFYIFVITLYSSLFYSSSVTSLNPKSMDDLKHWKKGSVKIQVDGNEGLELKVLIAGSNKERRQGLMHIEFMEEDQGMLFIFKPARKVSMWMRNTPLTLDMIFIDRDGKIINIAKNTTPYSTKGISSGGPISWVLEVNGGLSERINIKTGDLVSFKPIEDLDGE